MWRTTLTGWDKKRLRIVLVLFFLALAIPTAILVKQAYSQLKWEAFHRHRLMAEELVTRIDRRYTELLDIESARAFTDYSFLNLAGDPSANFLQRSPLSYFPVKSAIPGSIGYFQIDNEGRFSTPLLPDGDESSKVYGLTDPELAARQQARDRIYQLLSENRLVADIAIKERESRSLTESLDTIKSGALDLDDAADVGQSYRQQPATEQVMAQSGFDKLQTEADTSSPSLQSSSKSLGRIEDLQLENRYQQKLSEGKKKEVSRAKPSEKKDFKRALRKEQNVLPSQSTAIVMAEETPAAPRRDARVSMFESEIDAFEFSALGGGHFVLYRKVWREGQRYIQGLLIEPGPFIDDIIASAFRESAVSLTGNLAVAYQGDVLSVLSNRNNRRYMSSTESLQGSLLLHDRLSTPLGRMELIFSVTSLPAGPGATVITWLSLILLMVLCGGFLLMYRLAVGQITLARQQQDFVSAVSHELKTPLTSIRMYGEMLREGWASEEKRKTYYDFIYDESERLTRLINNVLQLARMTRNDLHAELTHCRVAQLMDTIRSKIESQVERAGFEFNIECKAHVLDQSLQVDADYFVQIIINLVDNAIKFSTKASKQQIDIGCTQLRDGTVQFSVRDYGPGIPQDQMRKIFRLFYRSENELTRETVGTGIGLALVRQLTRAMNGQIDVVNQTPGAEFKISFPTAPQVNTG